MPETGVVLSRLRATAKPTAAGAWPVLSASLESQPEGPGGALYVEDGYVDAGYVGGPTAYDASVLRANATWTGDALGVFRPTDGVQMVSFVRWSILAGFNGPTYQINPYILLRGRTRIRWTMDGTTFSFAYPARFAGDAAQMPANVPDSNARSIDGTTPMQSKYLTFEQYVRAQGNQVNAEIVVFPPNGGAALTVRLLTNGLIDNISEDHESGERAINGVDYIAKVRGWTSTLLFPPGHGQTVSTVVRRLLYVSGVTASGVIGVSVPGEPRMYKELQAADAPAVDLCDDILEPYQRQLRVDDFGVIRTVGLGRDLTRPVKFVFTDRDLISAPSFGGATDGPTTVYINGTRQVLREDGGHRTETAEVLSYRLYAPRIARKRQNSDGSLSSIGSAPVESLVLVGKTVRTIEYQGDTLVSERVQTWGWYNPQTWRYELNADGTLAAAYNANAYLYETDAATDDGNLSYLWPEERFVVLSDVLTRHVYDTRGYKTREEAVTDGWVLRRAAIKSRASAGDPWESESFDSVRILGNGQAVYGNDEVFAEPATISTTDYSVTDDRYIQRETLTKQGYGRRPGALYLYDDGEESQDAQETFLRLSADDTVYSENRDGSHSRTVYHFDASGRLVAMEDHPAEQGSLPAAAIAEEVLPDSTIYDDDAEREFARAASRYETQQFKVKVKSQAIWNYRGDNQKRINHPWVETSEAAQAMAEFEILEGYKYTATWSVSCCPWIRPGDRCHLWAKSLGLPLLDVFVREVELEEGEDRTLTHLSGDVYLA